MWTHVSSIETSASPAEVWAKFADVAGWKRWNAGIVNIELHGPFAEGTRFTMQVPGDDTFISTLRAVRENEEFTDETVVDDNRVRVFHRIEALPSGGSRISYSTEITGPQEAEFGPMVVGDFPDVLAALKRHLEIPAAEERLRLAMQASDVQALDRILADDLLFTNHMGQIVSKAQDLELHRSGMLSFRSVETVELQVLGNAALPMTSICVKLAGSYGGQNFEALLRFTRIWRQADNGQWQLAVAHSSPVLISSDSDKK